MQTYRLYQKALAPVGAIVVRLYHSGDQIRAYLREIEPDAPDHILSGEELEVDNALRLAENKQLDHPEIPTFIEMAEEVSWNPAWGTLQ